MPSSIQLLKQVRRTAHLIAENSEDPHQKILIGLMDLYLHELMLQDKPDFYLDHISQGYALVDEGMRIIQGMKPSFPMPDIKPNKANQDSRPEAVEKTITRLNGYLLNVIEDLDENRSDKEKDFLDRITRWESSLYLHRLEKVEFQQEEEKTLLTRDNFTHYLEHRFPQWVGLTVTSFKPVEGGLSKKTILVETRDELNGKQEIVIRAQQPYNILYLDGCELENEYHLLHVMFNAGLPIPEPLWLEQDADILGCAFLVSRRSSGSTIGDPTGPKCDVSPALLNSLMDTLIRIHQVELDPADPFVQKSHIAQWLPYKTVEEVTRFYVTEYLSKVIRRSGFNITPQMLRGLKWLENNVPECAEPPVLIHMDYGYHNILIEDDRVSAVLDWEISRMGDPADEIAWAQQTMGIYDMNEFLAIYNHKTGKSVSRYRIAYARVAYSLLNMIGSFTALRFIETDDKTPIHMGAIPFKYLPILSTNLDGLIADAEKARAL